MTSVSLSLIHIFLGMVAEAGSTRWEAREASTDLSGFGRNPCQSRCRTLLCQGGGVQGPAKARRMAGSVLTESLQRAGGAVSPERDLAPHEERGKGMQENRSPGISRRAFVTAGAVAGLSLIHI